MTKQLPSAQTCRFTILVSHNQLNLSFELQDGSHVPTYNLLVFNARASPIRPSQWIPRIKHIRQLLLNQPLIKARLHVTISHFHFRSKNLHTIFLTHSMFKVKFSKMIFLNNSKSRHRSLHSLTRLFRNESQNFHTTFLHHSMLKSRFSNILFLNNSKSRQGSL